MVFYHCKKTILFIQCKTGWGLSHVGSTKKVQDIFPCLNGITNILWSNLLSATLTLPFQFSFECVFLTTAGVVCLDKKRLGTFKYFPLPLSLLLLIAIGKYHLSQGELSDIVALIKWKKKSIHTLSSWEDLLKKKPTQDPVKIDEVYRTVNCHCSQMSY